MKFYRLETKEKKGVYHAIAGQREYKVWEKIQAEGERGTHPAPWQDSKLLTEARHLFEDTPFPPGLWTGADYVFGFSSMEQCRAWFFNDETLLAMEAAGILLNLYETNNCFIGNTQMVAHKETLDYIGDCNILTGEEK